MGRSPGIKRFAVLAALVLAILGLPATAQASYHLMKIREVHEGTGATGDYIELQMTSAGQNLVSGHFLALYDNGGNLMHSFQFTAGVANGENQRTILISDGGPIGTAPDFVDLGLNVVAPAGSACYLDSLPSSGIDCVTWGAAAPPTTNPSPVGMPVLFFGGLAEGQSIGRTIAPNCPTLLEDADDTTDSATDFALAPPNPRNNASAVTETPCAGSALPDTDIAQGPKPITRKKKATFEFTATIGGSSFECNLDGAGFQACASPHDVNVKKGKHSFQVRATDPAGNVDPSPAQANWKVKKRKHK